MTLASMPVVSTAVPAIASNDAITPTTTDAVRLHLLAVNGLAEALHVLRNSDCTAQDLSRAISRARRGLTNIKRLSACEVSK